MVEEGDIVEIPLPDGQSAIGWILHISQYFKGAVGFIVFGIKGRTREDVVIDFESGNPSSMTILGPLYTHIDAIKHYGWKTLAHQHVSDSKRLLTKRRVGGDVFVGDEFIGTVEDVDDSELRPMLAMGMPVVYTEIEKAFCNE